MKQFIKKIFFFILIGLIPLGILSLGYFYFDPFKVLKKQKNSLFREITPNRDFVSTEMFLRNCKNIQYNSFVFGSSRTLAFRPISWQKYLKINSRIFMFDASSESIYGIYKKLKFLDKLDIKLNNVLIVLCRSCSFDNDCNHKGYLFIKHPAISGESELRFQLEFYRTYLNPRYLFSFYDYKFTGKYKEYMKSYFEFGKTSIDSITNEMYEIDLEKQLKYDFLGYYRKRNTIFYNRTSEKKDSISRINENHLFILKEIKHILNKNKTNYKIVLSPLYEQVKFNSKDYYLLKKIFGRNIYDYSGKNKFTDLKTNYYENSHYKPFVGDSILKEIYSN